MKSSNFLILSLLFVGFSSLMTYDANQIVDHVKKSVRDATQGKSKLSPELLSLYGEKDGASGIKERHLLNNLCSLPGTRYLEIGVFHGSTFLAALFDNSSNIVDAIAIDNWSQFGNNKESFLSKAYRFLPQNSFRFIEQDAFSIDLKKLVNAPITTYFYDGDHSFESQYKAFTYFDPILADVFIAIVDDWNANAEKATRAAFKQLGYTILYEQSLRGNNGDVNNWWYGVYVVVIKKP